MITKRCFISGSLLFLVFACGAVIDLNAQTCCAIPTQETASRDGGPYGTYTTQWEMYVSDAAYTNFDGKSVFEYPTQQGDDTCYDGLGGKRKYPPLNLVSGGV